MKYNITFSSLLIILAILTSDKFTFSEPPFIPTMTSGTFIPTGTRYPGAAGFTRNDSAWIFIMGGLQDGNVISSACYKYNVKADSWETIPSLPMGPVWIGNGTRVGNKIYHLGGTNALFLNNCQTWVQVYDVNSNSWTSAAPMTYGRVYMGVTAYQDSLIYAAGGWGYPSGLVYNDVYVYNVNSNSWRTCTSMILSRCGGVLAVSHDTLVYVCGGSDWINPANQSTVCRGVISQTDRSVIAWDTTGAVYPAGPRSSLSGASWGTKGIVISGGYSFSGGAATNQCYIYSPGSNVWTIMPTLLSNRTDFGAASVNMTYLWKYVNVTGTSSRSGTNLTTVNILTDSMGVITSTSNNSNNVPNSFFLSQNYPNPFNPSTTIKFGLNKESYSRLVIYDAIGREVQTLIDGLLKAGSYEVMWQADNFNSGVYFCRFTSREYNKTIKLLLVK